MHYELYVDSLFFLNFIMNLYLLLLVDRSTLKTAALGRILAGAAVGAGCGLFPLLGMGSLFSRLAVGTLAGAAGMLCVAFPVRSMRMFLKLLERLVLYSFGLGGGMLFLVRLVPSARKALVSVPGILGMGILFFPLFLRFRNGFGTKDGLCRAVLSKNGERMEVAALIDSGNSLTEPISGKPVCVVDREVHDRLWEKEETGGFRAIPYHSIGRKRGILRGYLLPELTVKAEGMEVSFADVYIAVSEEEIAGANSADAKSVNMIINPRLFAEGKKGKPRMSAE